MIEFEQVTKRYDEPPQVVLDRFSASIQKGEFVLLTGRSGAGKTTCIRLLLKELEPDGGRIRVLDQDIRQIPRGGLPDYRRRLGVVFQETYLIPDQTVYENVELARLVVGGKKKKNRPMIISMLTLLGIAHLHKKYPRELSGGEKQKVCLARALVNYPEILLADEPTGNLSPRESREIMRLFEVVRRQGITVVVATHDRNSAEGLPYREISLDRERADTGVSDSGILLH